MGDVFGGVEKSKASFDTNYMKQGTYWCLINRCKRDESRKKREFFAVEMTVVHLVDVTEKGPRLGEDCSHLFMEGVEGNEGRIKSFMMCATGCKDEEVNKAACEAVCDEKTQPLHGTIVEVANRLITTKANKVIVGTSWKREIAPSELLAVIDPKVKERFFPGNLLEKLSTAAV